jgi:HYDIN/CFA65/VesB family protein/ASPM-SPD-2-Hydin domain-containing protein
MQVIREVKHDTSLPVRELQDMAGGEAAVSLSFPRTLPWRQSGLFTARTEQADAAVQSTILPALAVTPGLNFEGLGQGQYGFIVDFAPSDTNGAVGATQYVQWVNASFAVFDKKTGALLLGPTAGNTLWAGFGGPCQNDNDGDALAQYDKMAGRWVMSQLAVTGGPPFFECLAVSTTNDATGTYHRYAFQFANFDDYPKIGIWPDAYYFSFNMFDTTGTFFQGAQACALDRTAMLKGSAAKSVCFQQNTSVFGLLPSDFDGTILPPAGEPNFFVNYGLNSLNLWKFHVDFVTPANSTFTGPTNIPVAAFTRACNKFTDLICIEQPSTTVMLDSLADRLMYRLSYRRFTGTGAHESLVVNHTVDHTVGSLPITGIRWYEIRNPNATPNVFQQGTFQPDSNFRWMGSIAMDKAGDIALGYSLSSTSVRPSIAITGRVPSDPPGTMETETTIVNGTGSQTNLLTRWGDYSAMTVDPVDDCTFWYTQQYMQTTGSFNWNTRIANFQFPNCVGATPAAVLSATKLSFGKRLVGTTSPAKTVTLTNNGTAILNISSVTVSGDYAISGGTCGTTLAAASSCSVSTTFTPTAIGTRNGTLTFNDNAGTSPQTVALTGVGTIVSLSPASLNFLTVTVGTTSAPKSVTVTNTGTVAVTFTGFTLTGLNPGDFLISSNTCGSTLGAGLTCVVSLEIKPNVTGTRKATLSVTDNGGGSPQTVALTGTGTIVALSATAMNFGTVTVGTTSAAKSVTVTNTGTVAVTFTGFTLTGANPGDFLIPSNTCGSTLGAGLNCVVSVEIKPTVKGTRKATLNINDNGGGSPQTVTLTGVGG